MWNDKMTKTKEQTIQQQIDKAREEHPEWKSFCDKCNKKTHNDFKNNHFECHECKEWHGGAK